MIKWFWESKAGPENVLRGTRGTFARCKACGTEYSIPTLAFAEHTQCPKCGGRFGRAWEETGAPPGPLARAWALAIAFAKVILWHVFHLYGEVRWAMAGGACGGYYWALRACCNWTGRDWYFKETGKVFAYVGRPRW